MNWNKNMFIKKRRNNCNTGTLYTLTWISRIDNSTHTETILSMDINPISEDYVKHMLLVMAARKDLDSFLATVSESLPVQECEQQRYVYCTDPFLEQEMNQKYSKENK